MNLTLKPKNPVATFIDAYGDKQIIHRKQGRRLSVFNGGDTVSLKMNRAAAILIGKRIKERRQLLKLSQKQVCQFAGLQNVNPKQYIHAIESATRLTGCRTGTLYAIAYALSCDINELMPSLTEVMSYAEITPSSKFLSV